MSGGTMTYSINGRQFIIAVVQGARGEGAELVALSLPQPGEARGGGRGGRGGRAGAAPAEQQ